MFVHLIPFVASTSTQVRVKRYPWQSRKVFYPRTGF